MFRFLLTLSIAIFLTPLAAAQSRLSEMEPWIGTWSTNGRHHSFAGRSHIELAWGFDQRVLHFRQYNINEEGERYLTSEAHLWRDDSHNRLVGTSLSRVLDHGVLREVSAEIESDGSLLLTERLSCPSCAAALVSGDAAEIEVDLLRTSDDTTSWLRLSPPDGHAIIVSERWDSVYSPDGAPTDVALYLVERPACVPGGYSASTACRNAPPVPLRPLGFDQLREYFGDWVREDGSARLRINQTNPQSPRENRAARQYFHLIDGDWTPVATGYFSDAQHGMLTGLLRMAAIGEDGVNRITSRRVLRASYSETGLPPLEGNGLLFLQSHFRSRHYTEPQGFQSYEYWRLVADDELVIERWIMSKDGDLDFQSTELWRQQGQTAN